MSELPFNRDFAAYYDAFYAEKDYEGECDFVEALMTGCSGRRPRRIADIACGTGGHALRLARRGYQVVAIDQSAAMVDIAIAKADGEAIPVEWHVMPMQQLELARQVDVALCLFSSINYLVEDDDLRNALRRIRTVLAPGGLFIFDFLNGEAAIAGYSPVRVKRVRITDGEVLRISTTTLDTVRSRIDTHYDCVVMSAGRPVERFTDDQLKRFFFLPEVGYFLDTAGFDVVETCGFMKRNRPPDSGDWYIAVVARKREEDVQ